MSIELKEVSLIETKKEENEDSLKLLLINADLLHYYDAFVDVGFTIDSLLFDNDSFIPNVKDAFMMKDTEIIRLKRAIKILKRDKGINNIIKDDEKAKNIVNIKQFCEHHKLSKFIDDFEDNEIDLNELINYDENELNEYVIKPFNMKPLHIKRLKNGIQLEKTKQEEQDLANKTTESELQLVKYMDTIGKSRVALQTVLKGSINFGLRAGIPAASSVSTKSFLTAFQTVLRLSVIGTSVVIPGIGGLFSFGVEVTALTLGKQRLELSDDDYYRAIKKSAFSNISCSSCIAIGGAVGSPAGPVGVLVGTLIGLCVGLAAGYISDKVYDKLRPRKV